jgi:hypothetical protein
MSKIFRNSQVQEINDFLSTSNKISSALKGKILSELQDKGRQYKDSFIWLISRNEALTIDVFNIKGEVFETNTFYYKDFVNL